MKKKIKSFNDVFVKSFFVLAANIFLATTVGKGQVEIAAKDNAEILKVMNDASAKIEAALKEDKTLYNEMTDAMKKINSINDTAFLRTALASYRSKYLIKYGDVIKKAGVDINKMVADLKLRYPTIHFEVINNYAVKYKKIIPPGSYTAPKDETTAGTTTTIDLKSFTQDTKKEECTLAAGEVIFGSRSVLAKSSMITYCCGCIITGQIRKFEDLPSTAKSIRLRVYFYMSIGGRATSAGGVAYAAGHAYVDPIAGGHHLGSFDYLNSNVLAPFAWYAEFDEYDELTESFDITSYKGQYAGVMAEGYAKTSAAYVATTYSWGKAAITKAELIITK